MPGLALRDDPKGKRVVVEKDGRFIGVWSYPEALAAANTIFEIAGLTRSDDSKPPPVKAPPGPDPGGTSVSSATLEVERPNLREEVAALRLRVTTTWNLVDGDRAGLLDLHQAVLELQRKLNGPGSSAPSAPAGGTPPTGAAGGRPASARATKAPAQRTGPPPTTTSA